MNAVCLQESPPDKGGGCSCTPPRADSQTDLVDVDGSKAVLVIAPAFVYDMKGEVYALPADIV